MKVIATQHFVHGSHTLARGQEADIPDGIAADLQRAGFVKPATAKAALTASNKKAPPVANKMALPPSNKAAAK